VRQLERQRDDGIVIRPGRAWTVERWLTHWLENIAKPSVRYKPYIGYRTAVNRHLIPSLGAHRIDRIQPEHFEKLYTRMLARGLKPAIAHQVHRTARTAFGEAFKRGYIARNPVALAKPPRVEEPEVDPVRGRGDRAHPGPGAEQAQRGPVRRRARARTAARGSARAEMVTAARAQQDPGDHEGPATAGLAARLRRSSCVRRPLPQDQAVPGELKRHQRECPPPCPPDCTNHARWCPDRRGGGLVEVDIKSAADRRGIALPDKLLTLITELGGIVYHPEAIMLDVKPKRALTSIYDAVQAATRAVTGHEPDGASPRWIPHITICYSTTDQAIAPIIAALGPQQRECQVQIATVSLVTQHGPERLWDWRTVGAVHPPAPAQTRL
jgi:Phage integrase, N-terminal SAM-like domain